MPETPSRTRADGTDRKRRRKYRRARIRRILFTVGPDRLAGGRLRRRHLARGLSVNELDVHSSAWPAEFDGLRIAHVSDFHLGDLLPLPHAIEVVELISSLEPDIVACTGDLVDLHHDEAAPLLDALAAVPAPMGCVMVLGNHDELHNADELARQVRASGVTLLRDEALRYRRGDGDLIVAGIDWAKSAVACARHVDRACGPFAHLLLAHNPRAYLRAAEKGVPLTLSGHTHGGQIAMRRRPGANLAFTHRHSAGLYGDGLTNLYVTRGVGAWFPLRVNCDAEIAVITMHHAADTA